jgi:hypothetical protein
MMTSVVVCESCSFLWIKFSDFRGGAFIHFCSVLENLVFLLIVLPWLGAFAE